MKNKQKHKFLKYIYYKFLEPRYDYYYDQSITYLNIYDQYKKYGKFTIFQYTYNNGDYYYMLILGYDVAYRTYRTDNVEDFGFDDILKQYFKHEIENEIRKEKIKQLEILFI